AQHGFLSHPAATAGRTGGSHRAAGQTLYGCSVGKSGPGFYPDRCEYIMAVCRTSEATTAACRGRVAQRYRPPAVAAAPPVLALGNSLSSLGSIRPARQFFDNPTRS